LFRNIGKIDQVLRLSLGLLLVLLVILNVQTGRLGLFLAASGLYLLGTSLLRYCPFYHLIKYSTHDNYQH